MKIPLCLFCGDLSITNLHVFLYFQNLMSVAIHFTTHPFQTDINSLIPFFFNRPSYAILVKKRFLALGRTKSK